MTNFYGIEERSDTARTLNVVVDPVARPPRLSDAITEQLREMVLDGTLPAGAVLRQDDLSRALGTSRTPLREALFRLEQDGLIEFTPTGTATVIEISNEEARELTELREVIDGLAARKLAQKGVDAGTAEFLRSLVQTMDESLEAVDHADFLRNNAIFHVGILNFSGHRQMGRLASIVAMGSQAIYLDRTGSHHNRLLGAGHEHHDILQAILDGNADLAEKLAREHIRNARQHWIDDDDA